jgi:hypothetical protein
MEQVQAHFSHQTRQANLFPEQPPGDAFVRYDRPTEAFAFLHGHLFAPSRVGEDDQFISLVHRGQGSNQINHVNPCPYRL